MSENTNQITEEMNAFYERADEFIQLANTLRTDDIHAGKINASMLVCGRVLAHGQRQLVLSKVDYAKKNKTLLSIYQNFERMLSDNIDDYAENFQKYMQNWQK